MFTRSTPIQSLLRCLILTGWMASCATPASEKTADAPPPLDNLIEMQGANDTDKRTGKPLQPLEMTMVQPELEPKVVEKKGPRFTLSARDVEVRTLLMALAREIDQNIVLEPGINQRATVDLKDVTLVEALDSLLKPLRLQYAIEKDFIQVAAVKMETRVFYLDYVISRRQGSSSINASSGTGSAGGSTISGETSTAASATGASNVGGGSQSERSSSNIFTSEETDLWTEIEVGLGRLLTSSTGSATTSTAETLSAPTAEGQDTGLASSLLGAASGTGQPAATSAQPATTATQTQVETSYVTFNRQAGVIIVRDFPDVLLQVAEFLEAVEGSAQRQVLITGKIVEVVLDDNYKLGVDWSQVSPITITNPAGAFDTNNNNFGLGDADAARKSFKFADTAFSGAALFAYGIAPSRLNVIVDALKDQGDVKVLSSPKITTLNNQRAVIKVATDDIFFIPEITPATTTTAAVTEYIPSTITIGLVLDVVPQISANGNIMMSINTSLSEKQGERTSPDGVNVVPILDVRETNNVVIAESGQTIIIGGLMKSRIEKKSNSLPVLSAIPLVGRLFEYEKDVEKKSELVIMMTPRIMAGMAIDDSTRREQRLLDKFGFPQPRGGSRTPPITR